MYDTVIIGGGLAGLTAAINLAGKGFDVAVVEKNQYPFHKVCGEYISNEVKPYLHSMGVDLEELKPTAIRRFQLSSVSGRSFTLPLDMGGLGLSRYRLDNYLKELALKAGVTILEKVKVEDVSFSGNKFSIQPMSGELLEAKTVFGAYGKRASIDRKLDRDFFKQSSPWLAVKYHVKLDYPDDLIGLYNFPGGYCGISRIEDGKYCLCYLSTRENLRQHGDIRAMEEAVLYSNPLLRNFMSSATYLYDKPLVINEISFSNKEPVHSHMLMTGDTAGMIAPLCGNGMAMAIHAGKMAAEATAGFLSSKYARHTMESEYARRWKHEFAFRLRLGRNIQKLFGKEKVSRAAVSLIGSSPLLIRMIMKKTHGKPF